MRLNRKAALKLLRRPMKRHVKAEVLITDKLLSQGAAMKVTGTADRQETGRWLNNRAENSHQPFKRWERAMLRFKRIQSLQSFICVHASVNNHFSQERHLYSHDNFKLKRDAALSKRRQLCSA